MTNLPRTILFLALLGLAVVYGQRIIGSFASKAGV